MAKKNTSIHNHIDNVNVEIDYDKLAESIIVAANKAKTKSYRKHSVRSFIMTFCNGMVYLGFCVFIITKVYGMWSNFIETKQDLTSCIVFSIVGFVSTILCFLSQQESLNDSQEEIVLHFSNNISILALIIAFIALYNTPAI